MCSDGITGIFDKITWDLEKNTEYCVKTFGVRPVIDIIEKTYGGKNLNAASNIIFR